jgi:hypothetical protein
MLYVDVVTPVFVCSAAPPVAAAYQRKVPADPYDAETDVAPALQMVLFVTVGAAIAEVMVALTAVRADVHTPFVNST